MKKLKLVLCFAALAAGSFLLYSCGDDEGADEIQNVSTYQAGGTQTLSDGTSFTDTMEFTTGTLKGKQVLGSYDCTFKHKKTAGSSTSSGSFRLSNFNSEGVGQFENGKAKITFTYSALSPDKDSYLELTLKNDNSLDFHYVLWVVGQSFDKVERSGNVLLK